MRKRKSLNTNNNSLAQLTYVSILILAAILVGFNKIYGQSASELKKSNQAASSSASVSEKASVETFERLKKLSGKWSGKSTKGWTDQVTYGVMAAGSVAYEDSFDAHEAQRMMTMFYLDGKRLMLTHFCSSKTQPRLLATEFEDAGRKVTFTFLDSTNLPSRDNGHMDKLVMKFIDDDHFTSQWTWYQNGKEGWMEEIKYERVKTALR